MKIRFEILGSPMGKERPRMSVRGGKAHVYTPQKTLNYEELVRLSYKLQTNRQDTEKLWGKPLKALITAWIPVPRSFTQKERNAALSGKLRPLKTPDWDNIGKIVCDALNKLAYKDDCYIADGHVIKYYAAEPKVVVELETIEETKA